jgi:NTP pyrophosphatase (non-canonical NTP hydrolase)
MSLSFDNYQDQAATTAIYPQARTGSFNAVSYALLGLGNEAGEVQGKLKKVWRDNEGVIDHERAEGIADELGDVLWYLAAAATELGYSLSELGERNLAKLFSRKERGVIGGSGDNR